MNNKELYKLLKKNNLNSNSGFTLIELLVGLMMSIFVIGALGFGLMTVLATSQSENSKVKARTENSRALDFISDEVRRARTIQSFADSTNAPNFTPTDKTVVLALDIPEVSDSATIDSDDDDTTKTERVVYYLKSTGLGNWKGPQVLYRWGPPLDANGNYDDGDWEEEALIDGIGVKKADGNLAVVSTPCATGTVTPANPTGFYACITGSNTAQLFLTGQTKTASGVNYDSQTNDTQVVARARETLAYKTDKNNSITWNVESLGGKYNCKPPNDQWDMQTDFDNDLESDSNDITSWSQDGDVEGNGGKQPKPIEVRSDKPLKITSNPKLDSPADSADCLSSSDPVEHIINFDNLADFNGNSNCDEDGKNCDDNTKVKGDSDPTVQFFKKGSLVPNYGINYEDQKSLGKFLYDQGRAIPTSDIPAGKTLEEFLNDPETNFKIPASEQDINDYVDSLTGLTADEKIAEKAKFKILEDDQRIVGFEVGQTETTITKDDGSTEPNPGFDLQDNIFIVTSDIFKKKFDADGKEIKVEY